MSSDSEISSVEQSDSEETDPEVEIENDDVDVEVVLSLVQPYEDEPLADASTEPDMGEENEDADADGLYTNCFRGQIWKNGSSYFLVCKAISK